MKIDAQKANERFKNAYPAGLPQDILDLMADRLDMGHFWHVQQSIRPKRDRTYQQANEAGDRLRDLKKTGEQMQARAAELQRIIDSANPLNVTPAQMGAHLAELAGCERLIQLIAPSLSQAEQEKATAEATEREFSELARIVEKLTTHRLQMDREQRAELLADVLADDERRRILEAPEYIAKKAAEADETKARAEAEQRAKTKWAEWARAAEEEAAAANEPFERIDAMTKLEVFEAAFPGTKPETIRQQVLSNDSRLRYALAPYFGNVKGDPLKTYALERLCFLVETGKG